MSKLLLEMTSPEVKILSESIDEVTHEPVMRVQVKWQQADRINGNGRRYPRAILRREIEKLTPLVKQGRVMGASFHPKDEAEVNDVSHIWESIELRSDGACIGVVKVLPTSRGKDAQVIIRAGGHIGMSSRGHGTVTPREEEDVATGKRVKFDEVNEDFVLKSPGDFVLSPSVSDAGIIGMFEERFKDETTEPNLIEWSSEIVRRQEQEAAECRLRQEFYEALRAGWKGGTFEDYRQMRELAEGQKLEQSERCLADGEPTPTPAEHARWVEALQSGFKGTESDFLRTLGD